ncbi:MAG: NAD(+) diphosphatase [Treponema sp.]
MPVIETLNSENYTKALIFRGNKDVFLNPDGSVPDGKTAAKIIQAIPKNHIEHAVAENPASVFSLMLTKEADEPCGLQKNFVRECFATKDFATGAMIARARTMIKWSESMRFCSKCGDRLENSAAVSAKNCPRCGKEYFPRIEPCIIVLVKKGNEYLLARHVRHASDVFTCIAGFIEAGETAEHAVRREVKEETGIEIENVRYIKSQSWPYPDQLMLGFYADYVSGEITIQKEELHEAGWFHKDALPPIPLRGSMAYSLIMGDV